MLRLHSQKGKTVKTKSSLPKWFLKLKQIIINPKSDVWTAKNMYKMSKIVSKL